MLFVGCVIVLDVGCVLGCKVVAAVEPVWRQSGDSADEDQSCPDECAGAGLSGCAHDCAGGQVAE